jgi:hypothetical protein
VRERLSIVGVPLRRVVTINPDLAALIGARITPPPVELVRPADLVHLTFSFVNLRIDASARGQVPVLVRSATNRPAFLRVDCHAQHVTEQALFEVAAQFPIGKPTDDPPHPPPPLDLPAGTTPADFKDPDSEPQPDAFDLSDPDSVARLPPPPLFASLAGSSRLVFRVTNQAIPYSSAGLLAAMSRLELNVAPHAVPPRARRPRWIDIFDRIDLSPVLHTAIVQRRTMRRRRTPAAPGQSDVAAGLFSLGRLQATAQALEHRFDTTAALNGIAAAGVGGKLGIGDLIPDIDISAPIRIPPPLPRPPTPDETALELPWRLQISPNRHAAFAHSPDPIEHNGRFELWHTRLGVRATDRDGKPVLDADGQPTVDEEAADLRTVRAVWARDYEILPALHDEPKRTQFRFTSPPTGANFPNAGRFDDRPRQRMALNSRDRMMLVHETSNFHLERNRQPGWIPEAVPTNRLMVSALGGWLDSRVLFDTLPDGGLTIEEWKHRAALGRDHQVKVVYSGFLLPFGHKASLVKITERKFASGPAGPVAYLFQRMFIIVRQPEKRFRQDRRPLEDGRRPDLVMPFGMVRILTTVTPSLDEPEHLLPAAGGGQLFVPRVNEADFLFRLLAVDADNNLVEFAAPLVFMERDHNDTAGGALTAALSTYNTHGLVHRAFDLRGQRVAYAVSEQPDDTTLATRSVSFHVVTSNLIENVPQDEPRFLPVLDEARAVVPAMSALAGAAAPSRLKYHAHFGRKGFADNAVEAFLELPDTPEMRFAGQSDRSGGLTTPSLKVKALSRRTGPISGDVQKAVDGAADFNVGKFFDGVSAKLFGLIPLSQLLRATGPFDVGRLPKFVTQTLDVATTLQQNVERLRNAADQHVAQLGPAAGNLRADVDALLADLAVLAANPIAVPPDLGTRLDAIAGDLAGFAAAVQAAPDAVLPHPDKERLIGLVHRVGDQLDGAGAVDDAEQALVDFAQGLQLPEVVTARLDWSTQLDDWPASDDPATKAIFLPLGAGHRGRLTLAVEIQAPTRAGREPSVLVSCSISPFDLQLIAPVRFIILHFEVLELSIVPGKKPDVNVQFRQTDGIEFAGPLSFVNSLKRIIPFDGFSDPPYLDVSAEGIKAGFDLAIPDLAVGVFALTNISVGAHFLVPFIDESIETRFNFSTRENPFRLSIALFAGGGFFGVTITPQHVRVLEAAFEFGAAIEVNFGVASGGVSVMAGIYFRLETDTAGRTSAQLTGYFRLRGEVDVLGLISASIELYLEFTYETATRSAIGRATLTIEVEIFFFSFSVSISCEKRFAGSPADPSFEDVMGLSLAAPAGAVRPWDTYCHAFADE